MRLEENDIIEYEQIDRSASGKLLRHYTIRIPLSPNYMHPKVFDRLLGKTLGEEVQIVFNTAELGERTENNIYSIPKKIIKSSRPLQVGMLIKSKYLDKKMWGKIANISKDTVTVDFNSLTAESLNQHSTFVVKDICKKADWKAQTLPNDVKIHLDHGMVTVW